MGGSGSHGGGGAGTQAVVVVGQSPQSFFFSVLDNAVGYHFFRLWIILPFWASSKHGPTMEIRRSFNLYHAFFLFYSFIYPLIFKKTNNSRPFSIISHIYLFIIISFGLIPQLPLLLICKKIPLQTASYSRPSDCSFVPTLFSCLLNHTLLIYPLFLLKYKI